MENQTFDSAAADKAQREYCTREKEPHFAPTRTCYNCKQDIYRQIDHGKYKTGVSVEKAATSLITGCPHCNYSYCD